jgi:hypothetical protein
MGAHQSSLVQSWGSVLVPLIGAAMSMGVVNPAANAEGVVNGGSFIAGGVESGVSLIDTLGDTHLQAPLASDVSPRTGRVSARPTSLRERTVAEVGGDVFRHSRLALPMVMQSAVGESADAALVASDIRPMKGPLVGLKPHPRTWGSTLDR